MTLLLLPLILVLALLIAWSYLSHWWPGLMSPAVFRRGRAMKAWLLAVTSVCALTMGFVGAVVQPVGGAAGGTVGEVSTDALYYAAQQLLLNAPVEDGDNLWKHLSRVFALAFVAMVALEAVSRLFEGPLQRLTMTFWKDHVVICGLGSTGMHLTRQLRDPKEPGRYPHKVVVIESDASNPNVQIAKDLGAIVVVSDATDQSLLQRVRAHHAQLALFVTGSDETNLEGARDLSNLVGELRGSNRRALVHQRRTGISSILEHTEKSGVVISPFNVLEHTAADVVTRLLLPLRPRAQTEVLHVVLVGFTAMGRQLALSLAGLAHFENDKRTRLTIVHDESELAEVGRFVAQYPTLFARDSGDVGQDGVDGVSDARASAWSPDPARDAWSYGVFVADPEKPCDGDTGIAFVLNGGFCMMEGAPRSPEFVSRLVALAKQQGTKTVVMLCGEADEHNCTDGYELREELRNRLSVPQGSPLPVTIFAHVPNRPKLSEMVESSSLVVFGLESEVCSISTLAASHRRDIAVRLMGDFEKRPDFSASDFENEPVWKQRSNLAAAAHVPIKLAAVGFGLDTRLRGKPTSAVQAMFQNNGPRDVALPPAAPHVAHVMARMEHNRWVAERLLLGWRFAPAHDTSQRTRPSLVDWESLPRSERAKDREQIERLQRLCNPSGSATSASAIRVRKLRLEEDGGPHGAVAEESMRLLLQRDELLRAYVVGWTGHRERIVEHAVHEACVRQLQLVRAQAGPGGIVAIGAAAGGADSVFVAACREVGVPFVLLHASKDGPLTPELAEGALWVQSTPEHYVGEQHYVAIADAIVSRSRLLLAVWDDERRGGPGGTGDVVHRAAARVGEKGEPKCAVRIIDPVTGAVEEYRAQAGA